MSLYQRYAPPLGSMQLIAWVAVFIALPFFFAPVGFTFAVLALAFIVGIQPHIDRLSEEGHTLEFALREGRLFGFKLWKRREFSIRFHITNKKVSNSVATLLVLLFTFLFLPAMLYIIYRATSIFAIRIDARWETIASSLSESLEWARTVAPAYVPEGDMSAVFGGVIADTFGDFKHTITDISKEIASFIGHVVKAWFEIIIVVILLGVLVQNWIKETNSLRWRIEHGISDKMLVHRIFNFGKHYQNALSILIVGYLEVALTLSVYYFLVLSIFPFNLAFGFVLTISILFGFATAIPKIGGIGVKIISPIIVFMLFPEGFGYYGYEFASINLGIDLIIKSVLVFMIAFFGGYLEAYEYTPEIIGKKLGITKMEMVMTILIWAIGAKFMGMIYGVLLMLLIPSLTKLYREEEGIIESDKVKELPMFKHHKAS